MVDQHVGSGTAARISAVAATVGESTGFRGHVLRLVGLLAGEQAVGLDALVRASGLSRVGVEQVLRTVDPDLDPSVDGYRLRPAAAAAYRRAFDLPPRAPAPPDALVAPMQVVVDGAPAARRDLDHVVATPATALARARWLHERYDLSVHRILFVGDHDLTSIAAGLVDARAAGDVVDIDEDLLEYVDAQARQRSLDVRAFYADLRVGLPPELHGRAAVAVSDPPYTPDGMALFALRAAAGLRRSEFAELVLSYGFGERRPMLGNKVQQALLDAGFAIRAVLPDFNHYRGAQAIGSRSDLYVLAATSRTWKIADRERDDPDTIYTHGRQALEARSPGVPDDVLAGLAPFRAYVGAGAPRRSGLPSAHVPTVLRGGLPRALAPAASIAVDLTPDSGPALLRVLLAVNTARVSVVVAGHHPAIADDRQFRALAGLVDAKYALRREPVRGARGLACVVAERSTPSGADRVWADVLARGHGSWSTAWREALIAHRSRSGVALTKRDARQIVADHGPQHWAGRLIDLPRHQIRRLSKLVAASAQRL